MSQPKTNNLVHKGLPRAEDLEEVVLGALLVDNSGMIQVSDILVPDAFFNARHQIIYSAILDLHLQNTPIDLLTVSQALKKKEQLVGIGGDFYLVGLTQKVASSAHIEYHARIIMQKWAARRMIQCSQRQIEDNLEGTKDTFELMGQGIKEYVQIAEDLEKKRAYNLQELATRQIDHGRKIYRGEITPGLPTPITKLTNRTGGLRKGELIILAGRPGMGKTSFGLQLSHHIAKIGKPVAFFSLEMSKETLVNRIISMVSGIDGQKFTVHGLSEDDETLIESKNREFNAAPLLIDDTGALTIQEFKLKAKRLKAKNKIELIVLDFLQLMESNQKNNTREQVISSISRGLKATAKELDIPIVALSQLSRSVENRGGDRRPLLSDLRESGAIEQDADMVMFLYRPEYYYLPQWGPEYQNELTAGQAEFIVAKNRNGALVKGRMKFEAKFTRFGDLEESQDPFLEPATVMNFYETDTDSNEDHFL